MGIFISFKTPQNRVFMEKFKKELEDYVTRTGDHRFSPHISDLKSWVHPRYLEEVSLDWRLRDDDAAIAFVTKNYVNDPWLMHEIHTLNAVEKLRGKRFVLPVFVGDIPVARLRRLPDFPERLDFKEADTDEVLRTRAEELISKVKDIVEHSRPNIFISHSSKDRNVADALVNLFVASLKINPDTIRFTSGYGLQRIPPGVDPNELLRHEIYRARVLVGIITSNSAESSWVLFELGARWGAHLPQYPTLAGDASAGILPKPIADRAHAVSLDKHDQIQQLVYAVAGVLGKKIIDGQWAGYTSLVDKVLEASKSLTPS